MEQKPQEAKPEREVQGGVVFSKRQRPQAPAPNPMQSLFQNKLVLIIIGVIVLGVVGFAIFKISGCSKKTVKKDEQAVKESQKQEKAASAPAEAAKDAKPAQDAEAAKQTAAQPAESAELKLSEQAAGEAPAESVEQIEYKPPPKKPQPKKVKDTPGLMKILDEALVKGDESKLSYAVMGIEKNGDHVVDYLKEYIITNFNKPAQRTHAILALFYSSKGDAVAVIKTVLKVDHDEDVRLTALSVLDSLCGQEELDFIREVAKNDQSEKVRKRAMEYVEIRSIGQ